MTKTIKEILKKIKEIDNNTYSTHIAFCLDCFSSPNDDCYYNEHLILYRTVDCCDFHTAIEIIEWLIKRGYLKHE
jgi:hypothetical protein